MSAFVRRGVALAALIAAAAACARRDSGTARPAPGDSAGVPEHFQLSVTRSGGIAGMITSATIDGVTRRYTLSTSRGPGAEGASGELPEATVRAIARLVVDSLPEMRADYGITPGAADMFDYMVEASWGSVANGLDAHTVHADEGTAPEAMREIIARVFTAIERERAQ
jgi:hypothetical protein